MGLLRTARLYSVDPETIDTLEKNIHCVIADIRPQLHKCGVENWALLSIKYRQVLKPAVAICSSKEWVKKIWHYFRSPNLSQRTL